MAEINPKSPATNPIEVEIKHDYAQDKEDSTHIQGSGVTGLFRKAHSGMKKDRVKFGDAWIDANTKLRSNKPKETADKVSVYIKVKDPKTGNYKKGWIQLNKRSALIRLGHKDAFEKGEVKGDWTNEKVHKELEKEVARASFQPFSDDFSAAYPGFDMSEYPDAASFQNAGEAVHLVIENRDIGRLNKLLDMRVNLTHVNSQGDSPLETLISALLTEAEHPDKLATIKKMIGLLIDHGGKARPSTISSLIRYCSLNREQALIYRIERCGAENVVRAVGSEPKGEASKNTFQALSDYVSTNYPDFDMSPYNNIASLQVAGQPVHMAVVKKDLGLLEALVIAGADLNQKAQRGESALDVLVEELSIGANPHPHEPTQDPVERIHDKLMIDVLISAGAKMSTSTLVKLINTCEATDEQWLLKQIKSMGVENLDGGRIAHTILKRLKINNDCLWELIEAGVDVDSLDEDGCSLLYTAAAFGKDALAKDLLEKGANPDLAKSTPKNHPNRDFANLPPKETRVKTPRDAARRYVETLSEGEKSQYPTLVALARR